VRIGSTHKGPSPLSARAWLCSSKMRASVLLSPSELLLQEALSAVPSVWAADTPAATVIASVSANRRIAIMRPNAPSFTRSHHYFLRSMKILRGSVNLLRLPIGRVMFIQEWFFARGGTC
jgi:hypothetical protein